MVMATVMMCDVFLLVVVILNAVSSSGPDMARSTGPQMIMSNTRIIPSYSSFQSRSLVLCFAACIAASSLCESVSYCNSSSVCELIQLDSGATTTTETQWVSVVVSQQVITTTPTPTTTTPFWCPPGFVNFESKCYFLEISTQSSINGAVSTCDSMSAELLSIETDEEQQFIRLLMQDAGLNNNFWCSGRGTGAAYEWSSTSQPMVYQHFSTGEGGDYGTDRCVYLHGTDSFKWRLDSCSGGVNRYVCEYPKTV